MPENNKFAPIPVALLDDCMNIIASAKHTNFSFGEVANVVNALNHFKMQAAQESGSQQSGGALHEAPAPPLAESDMGTPAP